MASTSSGIPIHNFIYKKNSKILLRAGHQYCYKKSYKNGSDVWECVNRKKTKCRGQITMQANDVLKETNHSCKPDLKKNELALKIHELKEKVSSPQCPNVPAVYNSVLATLKDAATDLSADFPNFKNVKSTLYQHRNTAANVEKMNFKHVADVSVPPKFKPFLLADYNDGDIRLLAFCSEDARHHMAQLKIFFGDGTFKICPFPFYQLYTIHGDLGSTDNSTNIVPLIYVLMSGKTEKSYTVLFSVIKAQISEWQPQLYKCDFEIATMNAIRTVFPNVTVKGCYFHYLRAIWKKGRALNLTKSKIQKRQVSLSAVLPLLPEDQITNGWFYVASQSPDDNNSKKFRQYMLKHWLHDENFIKIWSVFGERHRTTNLLEAWHKKMNAIISKKKPNITQLLNVLFEDASVNEVRANKVSQNVHMENRTKRSMDMNDFIHETQTELINGSITIGHFLEKLK